MANFGRATPINSWGTLNIHPTHIDPVLSKFLISSAASGYIGWMVAKQWRKKNRLLFIFMKVLYGYSLWYTTRKQEFPSAIHSNVRDGLHFPFGKDLWIFLGIASSYFPRFFLFFRLNFELAFIFLIITLWKFRLFSLERKSSFPRVIQTASSGDPQLELSVALLEYLPN